MPLTTARVGVLMGGESAERQVSLKTGQAVFEALVRRGYNVVPIDVDSSLPERLLEEGIKMAFVALHGPGGEDGTIQGLLEIMKIPYTGSNVRASALALHKHAAKALLDYHGVPVPPGTVVRAGERGAKAIPPWIKKGTWPVVVKPATQGSTFGITIVHSASEWPRAIEKAHDFDREAVVESYIPGHEVTVSVLGGAVKALALPSIEIVVSGELYDYTAKYEKGFSRYLCPAPLSPTLQRRVKELALQAYTVLGCEGVARVDFRITPRGRPYVLEVNTVPGMTETSLLPMAAAKAGIDYDALTERILESAVRRARPN